MLKELRRIRQALERLTQPEPAPKTPPADQRGTLTPVLGPMMGKPDAPLTLVEFTDVQCPYRNRFTTTTFEQIRKADIDTGLVRFVSRDFPLDFRPQAMSVTVARVGGQSFTKNRGSRPWLKWSIRKRGGVAVVLPPHESQLSASRDNGVSFPAGRDHDLSPTRPRAA